MNLLSEERESQKGVDLIPVSVISVLSNHLSINAGSALSYPVTELVQRQLMVSLLLGLYSFNLLLPQISIYLIIGCLALKPTAINETWSLFLGSSSIQ
jgi:hypothetical protein